MLPTQQGAFRLFRAAGITVFLHWSWFLVAVFQIQRRGGTYATPLWDVLEYLTLFGIVLLHEFGHALACRSVGGRAEQIVLWPLGGVAYVQPPQRPGATLWSIAAGPLVNVVLLVILTGLLLVLGVTGWSRGLPDAQKYLLMVWLINLVLLVFNVLPIYPLDGGQILRSVLWFFLGPARSLLVATMVGFAGVALLIGLAIHWSSLWVGILAAFVLMNCWRGWQQARALLRLARLPRHQNYACPSCRSAPPLGPWRVCDGCGMSFDPFAAGGVCPQCGLTFPVTRCVDCGAASPLAAWAQPPVTRL
jgi:Zn-dependent protease